MEKGCFSEILIQKTGLQLIQNLRQGIQSKEQFKVHGGVNSDSGLSQEQQIFFYGEECFKRLNLTQDGELTNYDIWKAIFLSFKSNILKSFVIIQIQVFLRFILCLLIKYLFFSFQNGDTTMNYVYTSLIVFTYLLQSLVIQNGWRTVEHLSIKIKGATTHAIYKKILTFTSYNLGEKQIGNITNAVSGFYDILQNRSKYMFVVAAAPLSIICLTALLITIIGWFTLVGVGILVICEFIHYHYANYNSQFLEQVQKYKGSRIQLLHQVIDAIRYVKVQIWEELLLKKLLGIRKKQMGEYVKYGAGFSLELALSEGVSTACMLIVLKLTVLFSTQITALDAIITVLCIIQTKLIVVELSYGINCFYQVSVIFHKIREVFMIKADQMINLDAIQTQKKIKKRDQKVIRLKGVSLYLNDQLQNQKKILQNVTFSVKKGDFVGIYGPAGGGKSTLLNFIASQLPYYRGKFSINGSVSFVEQQPIIFSETIRQNILFGKEMDRFRYHKAIQYSCLKKDFDELPERDRTMVQEGGINLSGGQKTRICLARCFYQNKDIMLLDDPLSSLDTLIAKQIMSNLKKLNQKGKTIILATHQTSYLASIQNVYIIDGETIKKSNSVLFNQKPQQLNVPSKAQKRRSSTMIEDKFAFNLNFEHGNQKSSQSKDPKIRYDQNTLGFWSTLFRFILINKWNRLFFTLSIFLYIMSETLILLFVTLLGQYDKVLIGEATFVGNQTTFWIALGTMSISIFILQILRNYFLNYSIQLSNETLYENGLKKYFSLNVHEAEALGKKEMITKFSTDLGLLDIGLLPEIINQLNNIFAISTQCIVISIYYPIVFAFYAAIAVLCYIWYAYCFQAVALTKELEQESKSPIIGLFMETLLALTQINLQKSEKFMLKKFNKRLNKSLSVTYAFRKMYRVYCSYGIYISTIIISGCYFMLVGTLSAQDIFQLTFAATFLVDAYENIPPLISNFVKIASMLTSVQRLLKFHETNLEKTEQKEKQNQKSKKLQESMEIINHQSLSSLVPIIVVSKPSAETKVSMKAANQQKTSIVLDKLNLKYLKSQPPVLKDISLVIRQGQKVAFIGRTGAGKSSMLHLISRLVEPEPQSIYTIEGQDALTMPVSTLRSKFTCLPQTPFLFSDTLRKNVDPFDEHPQAQIVEILQAVKIWQKLQKLQINLDSELEKIFDHFSVGEKQLICMARAILQHRKFLILDEATSNVDLETDKLMQVLIRERFKDTTIIAVAHRLQTIADFDKVVVLQNGAIKQMGTPKQLYQMRGEFFTMVCSSQKNKQSLVKKIYERDQQSI